MDASLLKAERDDSQGPNKSIRSGESYDAEDDLLILKE